MKQISIQEIYAKIRTGKKLSKREEVFLEEYDNTHTDTEFNLIIGLNREMTQKEQQKIITACVSAIEALGYTEIEMG